MEESWECFQCGFKGTEREVEDHKCKEGGNIVVDKQGRKHRVVGIDSNADVVVKR